MQKKTTNRLILIVSCIFLGGLGIYMILYNLEQNIIFFYSPSQVDKIKLNNLVRVGGIVKLGSIIQVSPDEIDCTITDNIKDLQIHYKGILPSLFRENQGIVAQGKLVDTIFIATELLIKHDENYRPPYNINKMK